MDAVVWQYREILSEPRKKVGLFSLHHHGTYRSTLAQSTALFNYHAIFGVGLHQIQIVPEDDMKTIFTTIGGHFENRKVIFILLVFPQYSSAI